jgi:SsrA-binding protein
VKSLRQGHLILKDSYVDIRDGELYLVNAHIPPYEQGGRFNHEPERPRKLLMHKREIIRLASQIAEKGLTLVPLKVYFSRGKVKVEVGLCRGKAKADKREDLKAQEAKREMERAMRESRKG